MYEERAYEECLEADRITEGIERKDGGIWIPDNSDSVIFSPDGD
mgnify:CR=1 FL=1